MVGKSRKKWLYLTISEAALTKDLEIFSKMDPYCKFGVIKTSGKDTVWQETSVQDNIGLKPIWNESFFIELLEDVVEKDELHFIVMDSEVTSDRKIGESKLCLN